MNAGDVKLSCVVFGNITLSGVTLFIQKILPLLSFVLIIFQLIVAGAALWHLIKKRKNAKIPTPPDI